MTTLRALRKLLAFAAIFAASSLLLLPAKEAAAEPGSRNSAQQGQTVYVPRTTATGGYSLRLRDIWGPAKLPPAPTDVGPHYEITPGTGKWRLQTVEINGEIQMGDVRVNPGDLVVADDTGVVFIPRDQIMAVLEHCEKKKKGEDERVDAISKGVPVPVFYGKG